MRTDLKWWPAWKCDKLHAVPTSAQYETESVCGACGVPPMTLKPFRQKRIEAGMIPKCVHCVRLTGCEA